MQSAEDFAKEMGDDRNGMLTDKIALVRARDKEIVGACKKAISNGEPLNAGEFEARRERAEALKALDSVLRDLG